MMSYFILLHYIQGKNKLEKGHGQETVDRNVHISCIGVQPTILSLVRALGNHDKQLFRLNLMHKHVP